MKADLKTASYLLRCARRETTNGELGKDIDKFLSLAATHNDTCFMETLVDITRYAVNVGYHPDDSREIPQTCIALTEKFERIYHEAIDAGVAHEDCYIEAIDRFCEMEFCKLASQCSNLKGDAT